jgi:sodium-independent sulfate anion transporter 11
MAASKIGHAAAKVLRIKVDERQPRAGANDDKITRGESVFSVSSADYYLEEEPTSWEWISSLIPDRRGVARYFYNLFPFLHWIARYNLTWFAGDMVAGSYMTHPWHMEQC